MPSLADRWYKQAVVYALDVETFQDSDGDGCGDFAGLTHRLDYLVNLGITCLWLLPFYPTPNRDNGYDVSDYYGVDPRLGSMGDFVEFMQAARERGLRVIIDLVVNHTSDQHPWFQAARHSRESRYRDYYLWSEQRPDDWQQGMVFPGVQDSVWTHDDVADAWYFHRFYDFQPDLNIANPAVRDEIRKLMGFWLELGVSGFRVDAAPFLIELRGTAEDEIAVRDPYAYLTELREHVSWVRGDAVLLAEANVDAEDIPRYFGDGERMHMLFNFIADQYLFLALADQRRDALDHALQSLPALPPGGQWLNFLRNHDELDLGRLTPDERERVAAVFAPDPDMWIYDRGVRRRLAPMLGGDERRLKLAHSLLLTLPGTPMVRYGEEIGMGDDLTLPQREAVRTPMQWADTPNAGFSSAAPDALPRPVVREGPYGYPTINVEAQEHEPTSLLRWLRHVLAVRRDTPELAKGRWEAVDAGEPAVFAHRVQWRDGIVVALHNLSDQARSATIDVGQAARLDGATAAGGELEVQVTDLLAADRTRELLRGRCTFDLPPFGFRWLRLHGRSAQATDVR